MKFLLCLLLVASPFFVFTQSELRSISLDGAREVHVYAAFSSVYVTTGKTNAVLVDHALTVDGTDRPDLCYLTVERIDDVLYLREVKPNAQLSETKISRPRGGGNTGREARFNALLVDAVLKVVVPEGIPVRVETKYGAIEVVNVGQLLSARARYGGVKVVFTDRKAPAELELYSNYGGVDLTLPSGSSAKLDLTTEYGELITDLDVAINENTGTKRDFYRNVTGEIGRGDSRTKIRCEAPYGDVYLRSGQ